MVVLVYVMNSDLDFLPKLVDIAVQSVALSTGKCSVIFFC